MIPKQESKQVNTGYLKLMWDFEAISKDSKDQRINETEQTKTTEPVNMKIIHDLIYQLGRHDQSNENRFRDCFHKFNIQNLKHHDKMKKTSQQQTGQLSLRCSYSINASTLLTLNPTDRECTIYNEPT